jgi:hypothetical protein
VSIVADRERSIFTQPVRTATEISPPRADRECLTVIDTMMDNHGLPVGEAILSFQQF